MQIGISGRTDTDESIKLLHEVINYLLDKDIEVLVDSVLIKKLPEYEDIAIDLEDLEADLMITIGGDGTILRAQSFISGKNIPILGINLGTLGFLTEIDPKDVYMALNKVLANDYTIEERTLLRVLHGHELPSALNEVVVMTRKPAKMLHIEISVDNEIVERLRADGIIISTPSGSTAYSMSAGGPIVDPNVSAFLIVPICPFKISSRPYVVSNNSTIKIKLLQRDKIAMTVIDGQFEETFDFDKELVFEKSDKHTYFVRLNNGFYKRVREKLTDC